MSEAEQGLYTQMHLAVMAHEDEVRLGHPASERRYMNCKSMLLLNEFVTEDLKSSMLAIWAARSLPARLDVTQTSNLLGFGKASVMGETVDLVFVVCLIQGLMRR